MQSVTAEAPCLLSATPCIVGVTVYDAAVRAPAAELLPLRCMSFGPTAGTNQYVSKKVFVGVTSGLCYSGCS